MTQAFYPLLFRPVYKDYMWGGNRISKHFSREPGMPICAESWEISDRPEGMSIVENGVYAGKDLHWLMQNHATALLGESPPNTTFPFLVKILDASQRLSLQVHPNDDTAALYGGEAKSEMWYVLDAEANACVYAGLTPGTDEKRLQELIEAGSEETGVNRIGITSGDVLYVPGNRLHAIGEGCLILEVQQNSNTTYRVSDWGRLDPDGNPRELHLEEAFRIINWEDHAAGKERLSPHSAKPSATSRSLLKTPYFSAERFDIAGSQSIELRQQRFRILFCESGILELAWKDGTLELPLGRSVLIPAICDSLTLRTSRKAATLVSVVP